VQLQSIDTEGQRIEETQTAAAERLDRGEAVADCTAELADELRVDVADGQGLAPTGGGMSMQAWQQECRRLGQGLIGFMRMASQGVCMPT
jgi:hypothetical protein